MTPEQERAIAQARAIRAAQEKRAAAEAQQEVPFTERVMDSLTGAVPEAITPDVLKGPGARGARASALESLQTMIPGIQQAYGSAFDPALEREKGAEIEATQQRYAADKAAGNPAANIAGGAAPFLVGGAATAAVSKIPLLASLLRAAPTLPQASSVAGRIATGAATAAGGAGAAHLTRPIGDPNEGRAEGIGWPLAIGALTGGTVRSVGEGGRYFDNLLRAEDAAEEAVQSATGATRQSPTLPIYRKAADRARAQAEQLRSAWGARVEKIERSPQSKVRMDNTHALDAQTLPEELRDTLNERFRRPLQKGSTDTSAAGIIDPKTGRAFAFPNFQTLEDVRKTLRIVRAKRNNLPYGSEQAGAYRRLENALQKDIDAWGAKAPENAGTVAALTQMDKKYATEVAPLTDPTDKGRVTGRWRGKDETYSEADLNTQVGRPNQGDELSQLLDENPQSAPYIRRYEGSKMLSGDVDPKHFDPSTRRDVLFEGQDRARLTQIAEALRTGQGETVLPRALRTLENLPGVGAMLEKTRRGVPALIQRGPREQDVIAELLRAYGITAGANAGIE